MSSRLATIREPRFPRGYSPGFPVWFQSCDCNLQTKSMMGTRAWQQLSGKEYVQKQKRRNKRLPYSVA
ncbi:MAG: hypothetical protein KatS3mg023_3133 [Armatimonadota bacterium]|nr:MAG: hypothetical protein KatS3mg023_3133 [Armatimonadota bacterium]